MAPSLPLWLIRAGALLAAVAFFLPHAEWSGSLVGAPPAGHGSPLGVIRWLQARPWNPPAGPTLWLAAPIILSVFLLASALPAGRTNPRVRGACVGLLLLAAFAMSVFGSIQATSVQGTSSSLSPVVFFLVPVLLAGGVIARVLAGAEAAATGAFARVSLGALLALNAWCEAEVFGPISTRFLPGLYVAAVAGLLVAAGEGILLFRGEPSPQPLVASH